MSECTAYMEDGVVKDICQKCKAHYIVRNDNDSIWQPSTQIPVGKVTYEDISLCPRCRDDLITVIRRFRKG